MATTVKWFLIALLLLPSVSVAQQARTTADADIARYLSAVKFAAFYKDGVRRWQAEHVHPSKLILKVLNLPNGRIIAAVLPIFRNELSPPVAKELADFYSSSTGQAIILQQLAHPGGGEAHVALTVAQRLDLLHFAASPAGQAAVQLQQFERTDDFMREASIAVAAEARR